jgi:hypothetical protein
VETATAGDGVRGWEARRGNRRCVVEGGGRQRPDLATRSSEGGRAKCRRTHGGREKRRTTTDAAAADGATSFTRYPQTDLLTPIWFDGGQQRWRCVGGGEVPARRRRQGLDARRRGGPDAMRCEGGGEVASRCQGKGREGWPQGRRGGRPDDRKKTYQFFLVTSLFLGVEVAGKHGSRVDRNPYRGGVRCRTCVCYTAMVRRGFAARCFLRGGTCTLFAFDFGLA